MEIADLTERFAPSSIWLFQTNQDDQAVKVADLCKAGKEKWMA